MAAIETQHNLEENSSSDNFRSSNYLETVFYATVIGIVGGLVATAY